MRPSKSDPENLEDFSYFIFVRARVRVCVCVCVCVHCSQGSFHLEIIYLTTACISGV